jgi:hypothetical protein
MSILKTALANVSPSLPKAQAKVFAAFKIEPFVHSLIFGKGLSHADTITPSAIGMNAHAAKSALGGAVNVPGFITGLCWSLCALAHGQKKLAALQEGLPAASAYALEHGSSLFKPGAGISAGSLETVVLASLKAMLALPAPAKRVTAAAEDPTVVAARAESASKAEAERRAAAEAAEAALLPRLPRLPRLRLLPRLPLPRLRMLPRCCRGCCRCCRGCGLPRLRLLPRLRMLRLRKATFGQ